MTPEETAKARALELLLGAWDNALGEGVDPDMIASVSIFAALADMIDRYGEAAVAEFCASLQERVRTGEFTLKTDD